MVITDIRQLSALSTDMCKPKAAGPAAFAGMQVEYNPPFRQPPNSTRMCSAATYALFPMGLFQGFSFKGSAPYKGVFFSL